MLPQSLLLVQLEGEAIHQKSRLRFYVDYRHKPKKLYLKITPVGATGADTHAPMRSEYPMNLCFLFSENSGMHGQLLTNDLRYNIHKAIALENGNCHWCKASEFSAMPL